MFANVSINKYIVNELKLSQKILINVFLRIK